MVPFDKACINLGKSLKYCMEFPTKATDICGWGSGVGIMNATIVKMIAVAMGMYQFGSDKVVDDAMQHHDTLMQYLQQGMAEHIGYHDAVTALMGLFK